MVKKISYLIILIGSISCGHIEFYKPPDPSKTSVTELIIENISDEGNIFARLFQDPLTCSNPLTLGSQALGTPIFPGQSMKILIQQNKPITIEGLAGEIKLNGMFIESIETHAIVTFVPGKSTYKLAMRLPNQSKSGVQDHGKFNFLQQISQNWEEVNPSQYIKRRPHLPVTQSGPWAVPLTSDDIKKLGINTLP